MTAKIPLQNGEYAIVDKEDYERCMEYIWVFSKKSDVSSRVDGVMTTLSIFLKGKAKEGHVYIKSNLDKFDYRKENLVQVSKRTAALTSPPYSTNTTGYKGVSFKKQTGKYVAAITFRGKYNYLGTFYCKHEAAKAYNEAASELFGGYAFLNVIGKDNRKKQLTKVKRRQHRSKTRKLPRGVSQKFNRFDARITINGNLVHIGMFGTPKQAAKAYDQKAYELYGDKAILNFPELINEYKEDK